MCIEEDISKKKKLFSSSKNRRKEGTGLIRLGIFIFTEADSFEELRAMVHDAVSCHFDKDERPRISEGINPGNLI